MLCWFVFVFSVLLGGLRVQVAFSEGVGCMRIGGKKVVFVYSFLFLL